MDMRTFEALTLRDAIKAVKTEFGKDAVILKTREKAGAHGERLYEVTAAATSKNRVVGGASGSTAVDDGVWRDSMKGVESRLAAIADTMVTREHVMGLEAGLRELKFLLAESLRKRSDSQYENLPEPIANVARQLAIMGVDDTRLAELIKYLDSLPEKKGKDMADEEKAEYYKAQALRWMLKRIRIAPRWDVMSGALGIHCFVGPTGAGKTATVAKLAAHFHMKEKKSVLVVSLDNTRLAASDQMRVYCKILGVPFEFLNEARDLQAAIARHSDVELVLIDTAGKSPKNPKNIEDLAGLKELPLPVDYHLVLSVTEKEDQLDRSVRSFSKLGLQSAVFTKLDETWTYGEIFNLTTRWGLPISYFGIGQTVPEDLERATRERVVERIFGL